MILATLNTNETLQPVTNALFTLSTQKFCTVQAAGLDLYEILGYSFVLYFIGLFGIVFNRKNFLVTMMCAELMYLGVISSFAFYGILANDSAAQVYSLILLILAACESAIGLGLLIALHRFGHAVDFASYEQLGG